MQACGCSDADELCKYFCLSLAPIFFSDEIANENGQDFWDFHLGSFPTDEYVRERDSHGRILRAGGVRSNTLIIASVSGEQKNQEKPYMADFNNMQRLCMCDLSS